MSAYVLPYISICTELFEDGNAYEKLCSQNKIEILSTSHIRGITLDDAIILVDECQNLNFHELDSIITRVGQNSRVILSGDWSQSDFTKEEKKRYKYILRYSRTNEKL